MPPRKSNVSTTSNVPEDAPAESTPGRTTKKEDGLSVEDLSLPKSMIGRLAKGVLPANTQIHKDALLALHKSATVFVSYIAANSNDFAQGSGKKTISPQDVMSALREAELDEFIPRLEAELKKYNDTQCDKRNTYRRRVKEEKAAAEATNDDSEMQRDGVDGQANGLINGAHADGDVAERPSKKFKRENGDSMDFEAGDENDGTMNDDQDADDNQDDDDDDDDEEEADAAEDGEEEEEDDDVDDEEAQNEDEDALEDDSMTRNELRDEALDEPDSD